MTSHNTTSNNTSLDGITVLDMSRVLAGPWAGQLLGDLGATVIKVERPFIGDDTRKWGPPFVETLNGEHGDAAYFHAANRNKKSITIDISTQQGAELIRKLALKSDILIENYKVGGLKKYGLDFEALNNLHPRLVYCSITGFGQTGPYKDRAGYDYMIQAMGGLMSVTGQPDGTAGAEPMKVGVAVADLFAGLYASNAMLAALRHSERTGQGQHIDVALFDCQIAMLANQASNYLVSGQAPTRLGNAHPNIAPYQTFSASDAHIVIAVGNNQQFEKLCHIIESPELARDPRYTENVDRVKNRHSLANMITQKIITNTSTYWLAEFAKNGVPAGPINTIDNVFSDPHAIARGMSANDISEQTNVPHPIKYSQTPAKETLPPPLLNQHTDEVLSSMAGLTAQDITNLRANKVIQ